MLVAICQLAVVVRGRADGFAIVLNQCTLELCCVCFWLSVCWGGGAEVWGEKGRVT